MAEVGGEDREAKRCLRGAPSLPVPTSPEGRVELDRRGVWEWDQTQVSQAWVG